ncbi:speckle targeted PIP5K1A-regulated poly(A) polymerase-like [Linepithema humile]|uniref:speckle targeted PIP5K1A-regulated poly(A) polymerase-like n=1 Tax=Linepithema humile TaxID=83485 RepID=UPI0006235731|nr:PREDICTED: LOW QUALITY PROTEIN: speckle targeted PIP5K1A-regulated poly(A) polymerase-like [Linepithema humile]
MDSQLSVECSAQSNKHTNNQVATSSNHQEEKLGQKSQEENPHYVPGKSLCISPLPETISREELLKFLYQFGSVKRHHFERNSLWIEYHSSKPIYILTRKSNWLPNEKLCIRRIKKNKDDFDKGSKQKGKNVPNKTEEEEDLISYDRIKTGIENEVTFDGQLAALLNSIQLSDFELTTRYNVICTHLDEIFRPTFPECRTYRFGSTVAGLGFKESDLDIYMYVGRDGLSPALHRPDIPPHILTLSIFKKVKRVMYSMKSVFANIVSIPKAKTPIIKFRYAPTNVSCDISFKNSLGIYKSDFLKYCATCDPRIRPLMLLIKYWARHFGISGIGRISSYGLVCLIIFYLQQDFVGLLPPLLALQRTCAPRIINGWQVNFNENTVLPATTNNDNIAMLLHKFFSFYATFHFNSCVICLLDGKTYSAADFAQLDKLPDYMDRYKCCIMENGAKKLDIQKPMCLQDPIELNQNTAAVTSDRASIAFQRCCAFGAELCITASENNYENLLKMLFSTIPPELIITKKKKKKFKTKICAGRFLQDCQKIAGLPEDFEECTNVLDKEQYKKNNWYFLAFNLIRDIFKMVFKLQVEVLLDQETKQQKVEVLSDVHTRSHQNITFHCTGSKCVWYNRKKNNRTFLDIQLSLLEKEAITSDKVVEQLSEHEEANNIKLDFICVLEKADNPVAVILTLHDENSQNHIFRQFECFVNSWIPKIIDKTLLHMLQFQKTYDQLLQHAK